MLKLDNDESVSKILPVEEFNNNDFVFMATQKGVVKKTKLSYFAKKYKSGIKAINLDDDDILIGAAVTDGKQDILLAGSIKPPRAWAFPPGLSPRWPRLRIAPE